ncbi:MAG: BatA and WFA domain-containing protein [Chlorobi bacterium]|nr:BatA and WFA domain-containing protein [Chlorobiota bacterium]
MSFLNPLVLIALAAASIPFLLHLLNVRKLRRVEFSSLMFLKELQKTRVRKIKLKQILLLILRTALVIFVVLAFARPVLRGTSGLPGARAAATVVIIVDNSTSMEVRDDQGKRFKQAKDVVVRLLENLEQGDQAAIVPLSDPGKALEEGTSQNRERLIRQVVDLQTGYGGGRYADAIPVALQILESAPNLNREIYLITDAQNINSDGLQNAPFVIDRNTRLQVLPIGENGNLPANIGIDSLQLLTTLFEADKPLDVRAWVHHYGHKPIEDVSVALYIEENRAAQSSISLEPGESIAVELSAPPKRSGFLGGYVQVEGDDLQEDNRRYFAFRVIDGSRVAIVASGESRQLLEVLLGLPGLFHTQSFSSNALSTVDLNNFSAIALVDIPTTSSSMGKRLADYVESGGGLVIWAGPQVKATEFNSTLGAALRLPLGSLIQPTGDIPPLGFGRFEKGHPLFAGVFDRAKSRGRVESPEIYRVLPPGGGDPIITMTNGMPFMTELRRGKGRVLYIAVPPSRAWSDLPRRSIFVPIAVRSMLYVGASGEEYQQFLVGEEAFLTLPSREAVAEQIQVVPPSGEDIFVPVRPYESGVSISVDELREPGIYKVKSGQREIARFAANMDGRESNLRPTPEEEFRDLFAGCMEDPSNLAIFDPGDDLSNIVLQSRLGLELWRYMLTLALLCALAEMIVGRGKEEQG